MLEATLSSGGFLKAEDFVVLIPFNLFCLVHILALRLVPHFAVEL